MAHHSAAVSIQHNFVPVNLLANYDDPVDCLTAHLLLECSEVLAGVKPANLISLVNRTRPCGRNLYQLWQSVHQQAITRFDNLEFLVLQTKERAIMLLCYDKQLLNRHFAHVGIRTLLHKAGYQRDATVDLLLAELQQRITDQDTFPHEIGLFIGYPAKDVAAFMGLVKLPFTCQALWKIYGNPARSLNLAESYRCCRQRMGRLLASGNQQLLELKNPDHPFFCQSIDTEFHLLEGVPS